VTEALANVARHGYKGKPDQPICVRLAPAQNGPQRGLTIEIEDECQNVDLRQIKGRPLTEIRPGGLGVHIIREMMDHVEYSQRSNGHGVCLRMSKFAATKSPAQEE
jgi:anti-sigma regulatory factor (Ser/Thr protein kinase)